MKVFGIKLSWFFAIVAVAISIALVQRDAVHRAAIDDAIALNAEVLSSTSEKQALVFGGTSGIGQAIAERLAKGGASVTIVGRNEAAGAAIVERMSLSAPPATAAGAVPSFNFIKADLSSMSNGAAAVRQFVSGNGAAQRLDYLVFCQTKATLQGYTPTEGDGIDEKLALNYYSRVFIADLLMPLLEKTAKMMGTGTQRPRVMSVLSAGMHAPYEAYASDPYLSSPGSYSQKLAADITSFYSDLWVDKAAELHPTVEFVHVSPGLVDTNWGTDMPSPVRWAIRVLQKLPLVAKSASDCAELLLAGLVDYELAGGYASATPSDTGADDDAYYQFGRFYLLTEFAKPAKKTALHSTAAVDTVHADTWKLLEPLKKAAAKE